VSTADKWKDICLLSFITYIYFSEKIPFGGLWEPGSPNGGTQENCATTFIARFLTRKTRCLM
jgi:hypothetical protein